MHETYSLFCPICGMPKEFCVCEELGLGNPKTPDIKISTKDGWKKETIIEYNIDKEDNPNTAKIKYLTSQLKTTLKCGGRCEENRIILAGDHRTSVMKLLGLIK